MYNLPARIQLDWICIVMEVSVSVTEYIGFCAQLRGPLCWADCMSLPHPWIVFQNGAHQGVTATVLRPKSVLQAI